MSRIHPNWPDLRMSLRRFELDITQSGISDPDSMLLVAAFPRHNFPPIADARTRWSCPAHSACGIVATSTLLAIPPRDLVRLSQSRCFNHWPGEQGSL